MNKRKAQAWSSAAQACVGPIKVLTGSLAFRVVAIGKSKVSSPEVSQPKLGWSMYDARPAEGVTAARCSSQYRILYDKAPEQDRLYDGTEYSTQNAAMAQTASLQVCIAGEGAEADGALIITASLEEGHIAIVRGQSVPIRSTALALISKEGKDTLIIRTSGLYPTEIRSASRQIKVS